MVEEEGVAVSSSVVHHDDDQSAVPENVPEGSDESENVEETMTDDASKKRKAPDSTGSGKPEKRPKH